MDAEEARALKAAKQEAADSARLAADRLEIIREFLGAVDAGAFIVPNREPGRERSCKLIDRARIAAGQRKDPREKEESA